MQAPLILSTLALIAGVSGLAVAVLDPGEPPPSKDASLGRNDAELRQRLDDLEIENRSLWIRIEELEGVAGMATPQQAESRVPAGLDYVTREELDGLRREWLASLNGGAGVPYEPQTPEWKDSVASTLNQIRQEEGQARAEAWRQRRLTQLDGAMPKLTMALGLTAPQSRDLRAELEANMDRNADLARRYKQGEDPVVLGDEKRTNRETHQAALGTILNATQLEQYPAALRESGVGGK